jgi:methionine-rich copper-binding protein CopC
VSRRAENESSIRAGILISAMVCAVAQAQNVAVSVLPSDRATNVPLNAHLIVAMSYPATYFLEGAIKVTKAGAAVSGTLKAPTSSPLMPPQGAFGWFEFTPDRPFDPNTQYSVQIAAPNLPVLQTSFTTGSTADNTPLRLISTDPTPGQDAVKTNGRVTLRFNKPLDPYSFVQGVFSVRDLTTNYTGFAGTPQMQPDGATITMDLASNGNYGLVLGRAYRLEYSGSITDWLGNALSPAMDPVPFSTFRQTSKDGPLLTGSAPADGETGVALKSAIAVVFDKPLAQLAYDSAVTVDASGPMKFKLDSTIAGGRVLVIQPALLYPPNSQVTVKVTGLVDTFGAPLAGPITIGFRTGSLPETRNLAPGALPAAPYPQNGLVQVTFNRSIDPVLLGVGGVEVYASDNFVAHSSTAYQLSDDHRTISITPAAPLPAGTYRALISIPFERTAGKLQPFTLNFTVSGDQDTTAPQVTAVSPPDGTGDAPSTAVIQVAFSENVIASSSAPFQLNQNGDPVAGTFSITNGTRGAFVPKAPLQPGAGYQIAISGITDLAGHSLAPFTSSFSTAASNATDSFRIISIDPPQNATGVDPNAVITITFNRAVNPVSAATASGAFVLRGTSGYLPGVYQASGNTVTFTPSAPMPPDRYSFSPGGFTDLAGATMPSYFGLFQVSGNAVAPTPVTVISVSPADGQPVLYQDPYVVFTFSRPLDPSTVNSSNFVAWGPKGSLPVTASLIGNSAVVVKFTGAAGALVTLYVNPGVTDLAGNRATSFRSSVIVREVSSSPVSVTVRPGYRFSTIEQMNLAPTTGISFLFSAPVDRASVEQGLLVSANGVLVSGNFEWTPDSTGVTFLPLAPYPYSAAISYAIVSPARDAAGNPFTFDGGNYGVLSIAAAPSGSTAITVLGSSVAQAFVSMPSDAVIDLAFSQDVPSGFLTPKTAALTNTSKETIPCGATLISARVIRFRPQSALRPNGFYTFNFDSGTGVAYSVFVQVGITSTTPNPSVVAFGPNNQAVPLNAGITVAFSTRVSELTMPGGVTLEANGAAVPTRYVWGQNDHAVTVVPLALLHANTDYTVVASGFFDLAGTAIPARSWTFHTSAVLDRDTPSVVRIDPSGAGASANTAVTVTFSEPVAADWIDGFRVQDASNSVIAGKLTFSDDQRTLFFFPSSPLVPGMTYTVFVPGSFGDFAGNVLTVSGGSVTASFRVALNAANAPALTAATPDDGAVGVPLNALLQLQFNQPVLSTSLDGVQLFEQGVALPATLRVEADGRTVTAVPQRLPAPGSVVTVTAAGVKNSAGAPWAGTYQASFTMGSTVEITPVALLSSPASGQSEVPLNAVLRIRSAKPFNKLSVTPDNVSLRWIPFGVVAAGVQLQDGGRTIVVTPAQPLARNSQYTISLRSVADLAGNQVGGFAGDTVSIGFSTTSGAAGNPARLLALDPPDGSTIGPAAQIQALFNQPVDLTQGVDGVVLTGPYGNVAGSVTFGVSGTQYGFGSLISFTPKRTLVDGQYQLSLNGIADVAGNPLPPVGSTFTVDSTSSSNVGLRLTSSSPVNNAVGVDVSSAITLTFSRPVSSVFAVQLRVGTQTTSIPGSFQIEGALVTFTPSVPMPGAATVNVTGFIRDLQGGSTNVSVQFTTGANLDTTPPVLEFAYPADGSTSAAAGGNIVLRFSEPVVISPGGIQILIGSSAGTLTLYAGEDGRTFVSQLSLPPNTDIAIASTDGVRDFAGNRCAPFTIRFHTATDANSRSPQISVSPANGAVNVPLTQPVEIRFSQPVDGGTVQSNLHVYDVSSTVTGALNADAASQVFDFPPDVPYGAGDLISVALDNSVYTLTGVRVDPAVFSSFRTVQPPATSPAPVFFSASATAVDVRFDGPVRTCENYLRVGANRVSATCAITAEDQIRVTPAIPLNTQVAYRLVVDAAHEIAFEAPADEPVDNQEAESIERDPTGVITVRFRRPVNPLSIRRSLRLSAPNGRPVSFTMQSNLDATQFRLTPAHPSPDLEIRRE